MNLILHQQNHDFSSHSRSTWSNQGSYNSNLSRLNSLLTNCREPIYTRYSSCATHRSLVKTSHSDNIPALVFPNNQIYCEREGHRFDVLQSLFRRGRPLRIDGLLAGQGMRCFPAQNQEGHDYYALTGLVMMEEMIEMGTGSSRRIESHGGGGGGSVVVLAALSCGALGNLDDDLCSEVSASSFSIVLWKSVFSRIVYRSSRR